MGKKLFPIDSYIDWLSHFSSDLTQESKSKSVTIQVTVTDLELPADIFLFLLYKSLLDYINLLNTSINYLMLSDEQSKYKVYHKLFTTAENRDVSIILKNVKILRGEDVPQLSLTRRTVLDFYNFDNLKFQGMKLTLDNSITVSCILKDVTSLHLKNHSNCNISVEDVDVLLEEVVVEDSSLVLTSPFLLKYKDGTHNHKTYAYIGTTFKCNMSMIYEEILSPFSDSESTDELVSEEISEEGTCVEPWNNISVDAQRQIKSTQVKETTISKLRRKSKEKEIISTSVYSKPSKVEVSLKNSDLLAIHSQRGVIAYFDSIGKSLNLITDIRGKTDTVLQPIAEEYFKQDIEMLKCILHMDYDDSIPIERVEQLYVTTLLKTMISREDEDSMLWLADLLTNLPDMVKRTVPRHLLRSGALQDNIMDYLGEWSRQAHDTNYR